MRIFLFALAETPENSGQQQEIVHINLYEYSLTDCSGCGFCPSHCQSVTPCPLMSRRFMSLDNQELEVSIASSALHICCNVDGVHCEPREPRDISPRRNRIDSPSESIQRSSNPD
jgi:heterodisulfide reductase subunit C